MITIGIHYCNIHEYISDIRHLLNDNNDYIMVDGVPLRDLLSDPGYKFIIIKNDYDYITTFVSSYGSYQEQLRLSDFLNSPSLEILDLEIKNNFLFAIVDYCENNNYRCLVTKKDVHKFTIRLAFNCKDYALFYNIPRDNYTQIILTKSICLAIILKNKLNITSDKMLLIDYLHSYLLYGKEHLVIKSTMDDIMNYIYLHGDKEDIETMNTFFLDKTIITNVGLYISSNLRVKESNYDIIVKYRPKFVEASSYSPNKKAANYNEMMLSKGLNIPLIVSHQKCLPSGNDKNKILLIYSKLHPHFF